MEPKNKSVLRARFRYKYVCYDFLDVCTGGIYEKLTFKSQIGSLHLNVKESF